ncbi:hypothetical protein PanWU01x14_192820 [Parasponia andersonii]|uniref:Uncharacterized protein n=1 Tax=Parasponia andersonii TaxID=3476 RepID=A0A2P5C183_PARAD|nr:hypothetical protein PanWU01x14_192820 [Parasponia andersonii]
MLLPRSRYSREVMFPKASGIEPSKRLRLRSKYLRDVMFPKASGMEPSKRLRLRSKYLRDVMFPKASGMEPSNWLDERTRRTKLPLKVDKKISMEAAERWFPERSTLARYMEELLKGERDGGMKFFCDTRPQFFSSKFSR